MRINPARFLPHLKGLRFDQIEITEHHITLTLVAVRATAACPLCQHRSKRVHSYYGRTVADLPWGGLTVALRVQTRRFVCPITSCVRKVFCERLAPFVAVYGRRTHAVRAALLRIARALGGKAGARLAARQGIGVSRMTLLRLIHADRAPAADTPRAIGIDDWSQRRGRRYGSIVVDLERHRTIDLLPDRTAETFAAWLRAHPGIEIISRDRAGAYADGARQGAPQATQVADRWHLLSNLREVVERVLTREQASVRAAAAVLRPAPAGDGAGATEGHGTCERAVASPAEGRTPAAASPRRTRLEEEQCDRRARRQARYAEVMALHRRGLSQRTIARALGVGRHTIRTFLRAGAFPERRPRTTGATMLTPFEPYLRARWDAGCQHVPTLWAELQARGFTGSARTVRGHVARWRAEPARRGPQPKHPLRKRVALPAPPAVRTFSVRQATWLMLRPPTDLDAEEQAYLGELLRVCPPAATACRLAQAFFALVRERDAAALDGWLGEAARSDLPEMGGFALGIRRDRAAVDAGLTLDWSQGQTEGFVNKLKTLKRQMFGRAGLTLLRERMLDGG
jgi:transposase